MIKKKYSTSRKSTKASKSPKVNVLTCPKDMTLEDWQRLLRTNAAEKESFGINPPSDGSSVFEVTSAKSGRTYHVEYYGKVSTFNRCDCMDFRTNQLGTCKHIEALKMHKNQRYVYPKISYPQNSAVIIDYTQGRVIRLRTTLETRKQLIELGRGIFDKDGILVDYKCNVADFSHKARNIDPNFVWESDALDLVIATRDKEYRKKVLDEKYRVSDLTGLLKTRLHPYQVDGVKFAFAEGRTINADEMGLGKTVQAIAAAELLKREGLVESVIIICPTSLKYQWLSEIKRFTDSTAMVVEGDLIKRRTQFDDTDYFYKICSYQAITNNVKSGNIPAADMIIYDELQRLKNWDTQMGRQLRKLSSEYVLALSGTPLENKLNELYSVTQFVDQFVLGPLYKFNALTTMLDESGRIVGYRNLHAVSEMLSHTLIRRRKSEVKLQMPSRTDTNMFVPMTREQMAIHDEYKFNVAMLINKWHRFKYLSDADRKRLLLYLSMMRMVCDSTFILDQKTRHDTKIDETMEIIGNLLETPDGKVVIFSQWERMLRIISKELENRGIDFCYLHGGVPSVKRKDLIERFRDDANCRIFLSTDAGSTGLNLQVASLVVNLDLPWNPAVLEQRIARVYRLGQLNPVHIINMVSRNTIEERMLSTLKFKSNLSAGILDGGEDAVFLENDKFGKMVDMLGTMIKVDEDTDTAPSTDSSTPSVPLEAESKNHEPKGEPAHQAAPSETAVQPKAASTDGAPKEKDAPRSKEEVHSIVAEGMNFFGKLADILRQPEGARTLTDALVKEDPDTGQASLNIPIPDKQTVTTLLSAIATMLK